MIHQQGKDSSSTATSGRRVAAWPISRKGRVPATLGFQLLVTVNGAMAVLVAAFLVLDYRREFSGRLEQKRVALQEEAKTILPAVLHLRAERDQPMQKYLDAVCGRMRDAESPGHHIAVQNGAAVVQSTAHGRASPAMFRAMQAAASVPSTAGSLGDQDLVVGSASQGEITVYVSEDATSLRRAVFGQILWRLSGMLAMGVVAAVLVSVILLHTVANPVKRLVDAVTAISNGRFETRIGAANSRELAALSSAMDDMAESLRRTAEQRQTEMTQAREIQEHLLPRAAVVPGMALAAFYHPATDVAGDYYDALPLPDGSWLLCVADVCGHGVPAAMSAAMLKSLLVHATEHHVTPDELLQFINERFIALSPPGLFASMLLVRWQPQRGTVQYASAGHEPAWLIRADGSIRRLDATGFLLGIEPDAAWRMQQFVPCSGERLVAMTDGVAEALSPKEELFGRDRLQTLMADFEGKYLEQLLGRLNRALFEHRGGRAATDDTTVLAVEFLADAVPMRWRGPPLGSLALHRDSEQRLGQVG